MINRKKLAYRIIDLCQSSGLTQHELASRIGVWESGLCMWCTGKNIPNLESCYKIAKYFNITIDKLLEGCIE